MEGEVGMRASIWKPTLVATLICGTLDILLAVILSTLFGKGPAAMLRFVASGPFPGATEWGAAGSAIGLATPFPLLAVIVTPFMVAAREWPALLDRPVVAAIGYGLITYIAMNLIVVPLRFDTPLPPSTR